MSDNDEGKIFYRKLGHTGLKVSVLSFGAWVTFGNQVDVPQAKKILKQCFDAGVNFFDNAEVYESGKAEEVMGQAFKELDIPRKDLVISTKIFWAGPGPNDVGLSRKHIIEGTKASLKRLQLDYVDVIFAHRPDHTTPIEETVRAFNYVIEKGWAFYWGTSEWTAAQITEAKKIAERLQLIPPTVEQPQYNLFERYKVEYHFRELYNTDSGLGLTIWSPLASGLLSGKYSKDSVPEGSRFALEKYKGLKEKKLTEENLTKVDELKKVAADLGASLPQLAIAWTAKNTNVSTVIMGATKEAQIEDNLASIKLLKKLTPEVLEKIEKIVKNKPSSKDERPDITDPSKSFNDSFLDKSTQSKAYVSSD